MISYFVHAKRIAATLIGASLALGYCAPSYAAKQTAGQICHLPGQEGPLRCLYLSVPRDYTDANKGSLDLHVTIAPAFREKSMADPLFVLAGGPGQSGSSIVYLLDYGLQRVRATRDIIFIDQRGTGKSGKLTCDALTRSETMDAEKGEQELRDCLTSLKPDLSQYTTGNAARDMEKVRQALGYRQINVWGGSYGTRLAQEYAQQFPSSLRSMVIDGVTSPQQNLGLMGNETGKAFALLVKKCQKDAVCNNKFPHFAQELDDLVSRAKSGKEIIHFRHPVTGKELQTPLRYEGLAEGIRMMLYSPTTSARLPWLVQQAHRGNWQPIMVGAVANQSWSQDGMAVGLTLAVICGEDVAHLQPAQIAAETPLSFIGDTWATKMQRWCGYLKLPQRERPSTSIINTPTLLLSGALDPVTPPSRAQEAMQRLPHSQHIIVDNAGHIVTPYGCIPRLLRQFFDEPNKKVDSSCLKEIGNSPFAVSAAGAEP